MGVDERKRPLLDKRHGGGGASQTYTAGDVAPPLPSSAAFGGEINGNNGGGGSGGGSGSGGVIHIPATSCGDDVMTASELRKQQQRERITFWRQASIMFLTYFSLAVLYFTVGSGLSVIDALYLTVVTITTVGYGDVDTATSTDLVLTILLVMFGVGLVAGLLSQFIDDVMHVQEQKFFAAMEKRVLQRDSSSHGECDGHPGTCSENGSIAEQPKEGGKDKWGCWESAYRFTGVPRELLTEVIFHSSVFLLCVVVGTVVFSFDHLSVMQALYLTIITASTVGYGDFSPHAKWARVFAIFYLPIMTFCMAKWITLLAEAMSSRKAELRHHRMLHAKLTQQDFQQMDSSKDNRISRAEYLCYKLIEMELVSQETLDELNETFDELDLDKTGYIDQDEITGS